VIAEFQVEPLALAIMASAQPRVPVMAGLVPVVGGARTTIRAAISGYGLGGTGRQGLVDRLLGRTSADPLAAAPDLAAQHGAAQSQAGPHAGNARVGRSDLHGRNQRQELDDHGQHRRMYRYDTGDVNIEFDSPSGSARWTQCWRDYARRHRVEGWIFTGGRGAGRPTEDGGKPRRVAIDRIKITAPPLDSASSREVVEGRWLARVT
jgi:hypothetical protein